MKHTHKKKIIVCRKTLNKRRERKKIAKKAVPKLFALQGYTINFSKFLPKITSSSIC